MSMDEVLQKIHTADEELKWAKSTVTRLLLEHPAGLTFPELNKLVWAKQPHFASLASIVVNLVAWALGELGVEGKIKCCFDMVDTPDVVYCLTTGAWLQAARRWGEQ